MVSITEYLKFVKALESHPANLTVTAKIPEFEGLNVARLIHCALGLSTEALELLEQHRGASRDNQIREVGDISFFATMLCDELGCLPTDAELKAAPLVKINTLCTLCEDVASRIKAGLFYGTPVKPNDPPGYWKHSAKNILMWAHAIPRNSGGTDVFKVIMTKLETRYKAKTFDPKAAVNRDTKQEDAASAAVITGVPPKPKSTLELLGSLQR